MKTGWWINKRFRNRVKVVHFADGWVWAYPAEDIAGRPSMIRQDTFLATHEYKGNVP